MFLFTRSDKMYFTLLQKYIPSVFIRVNLFAEIAVIITF